jgi:hypothetical protein
MLTATGPCVIVKMGNTSVEAARGRTATAGFADAGLSIDATCRGRLLLGPHVVARGLDCTPNAYFICLAAKQPHTALSLWNCHWILFALYMLACPWPLLEVALLAASKVAH